MLKRLSSSLLENFKTKPQYPTAPIPTDGLPPGVPYIVGNEAAERFSFYGMRAILTIFMTQYLLDAHGRLAPMSESEAKFYFHLFNAGVYFFPIVGAILADIFWGKYSTIVGLSLVYCLGHVALAWDETRLGLFVGLTLIAVGSGGIKSCVSAHVGDQFASRNSHRMGEVFAWFYLAINLGA
ncbi:MAG TPA: MFS transporter, partial [Thermogutta sp.]|nr:MFS transporter [Thermogutta sp.]